MKPLVGEAMLEGDDGSDELEFEMPSKQFFQDIGMLVVEGRLPHPSDKGRNEGPHCPSVLGAHTHICEDFNKLMCQQATTWLETMESLWQSGLPMYIDVFVDVSDADDGVVKKDDNHTKLIVLVERWKVECKERVQKSASCSTSGHMLLQAIRSNIHFSQLSAWLSSSKGTFPRHIHYRIYGDDECNTDSGAFLDTPKHHVFPLATLPNNTVLLVEVLALPRIDLCELWHLLQTRHNNGSRCKMLYEAQNNCETSPSCDSFIDVNSSISSPLRKKPFKIESSSSSVDNHVTLANGEDQQQTKSRTCKKLENLDSFNSHLSEDQQNIFGITRMLQKLNADKEKGTVKEFIGSNSDHCIKSLEDFKSLSRNRCDKISEKVSDTQSAKNGFSDIKLRPRRKGTYGRSLSHDNPIETSRPNAKSLQRMILQSSEPSKSCTIPIFNAKTGLPISSSPAVLRKSTTELCEHGHNGLLLRDSFTKPDCKDLSRILSKSAPASTSLSGLLGNFEESVLNGRMEPVGTVQGFTAELGASGTFCPSHVMLPITAYFFKLSDDDAPSPYMGYIGLDEPLVGKRGYHVPRKGTIQLTVFNPNKTVLKVFVVLYNFADMPPKSQTFLRQRTFSVCKANAEREPQTTLHYLVHLRFKSSKSGKIYLHTNIRVIFARQPPDFYGHPDWDVKTVTDGPTDPRYTPRNQDL